MRKQGRFEKKKVKKTLGGKKIALIVGCSILVLLLAAVVFGIVYYNSILDKMTIVEVPKIEYTTEVTEPVETTLEATEGETTEATTVVTTEPHVASSEDYINILVVGQAARDGEAERFADTMILVTLNTYEKTVTLTSMLRDTLVQQSGSYDNGKHTWGGIKLTTVYHLGYLWDETPGAMAVINQTLYNNFGIEVDYNFEVDFDAFVKVVDTLGGVELELTQAEADYLNDDDLWVYYDMQPGLQRLDGMTALSYARMRKAEGDNESDINRTSRQRKLIQALVEKLKTWSPGSLQDLAYDVLPMITTSMSKSEITEILLKVVPILWEMEFQTGGTCPAEYWGEIVDIYDDGYPDSVLKFDVAATKKHMRAITEGEK